jgi:hypothetical protein
VKKDQSLSLPLWLASYLATSSIGASPALTMDLPASLAPRVLNALKADPRTVDLRAQAPYFYEVACRALDLFEEDDIVDVLVDVSRVPSGWIQRKTWEEGRAKPRWKGDGLVMRLPRLTVCSPRGRRHSRSAPP